ncbi:MAG TPA: carbon-nitrogen hydrolase family protein [Phenylobacterium sp.]|nr:carbon-nitrogen hydrolase family protein [Phenylobacterium sp.]
MPLRLAVAQSHVGLDPRANGAAVRALMRRAHEAGARLVQFPEGAVSGYVGGAGKIHFAGWNLDWDELTAELEETAALAAKLKLWVVAGANHRLTSPNRPHNSLYVISDQGALVARYDKRRLSHNEVTDWYAPGFEAVLFEVDGFRFGLTLCIEINFPEMFADYAARGADAVLFSSYSEDPVFAVLARAHAAANNLWIGMSVPAQCSRAASSGVIGPHGGWLGCCAADGEPGLAVVDLDRDAPDLDVALNKAKPWREIARAGAIYEARRVDDPRSLDRTRF